MAPEILLHSKYSESADIFSLGLLYIEIYIEKSPYNQVQVKYMLDIVKKFKSKEMVPEIPVPSVHKCPYVLVSLIKQMISYEPKERYEYLNKMKMIDFYNNNILLLNRPSASIIYQNMIEKRMKLQLEELLKENEEIDL
jgi:serine/threonine protein kinase